MRPSFFALLIFASCASAVGDDDFDEDEMQVQHWALLGDMEAQNTLALAYLNGDFGYQSPEEARLWFSRAAELGHPGAQTNLGLLYLTGEGAEKDEASALDLLNMAAKQNFSSAQLILGSLYELGQSVPQDFEKAAGFYQRAASQRNPAAQYHLAMMYRDGHGVPKDEKKLLFYLGKLQRGVYLPRSSNWADIICTVLEQKSPTAHREAETAKAHRG